MNSERKRRDRLPMTGSGPFLLYSIIMIFQHISTTFCCKDRRTAASFLQQMGVRSKGSAPELLIREVTKVRRWIRVQDSAQNSKYRSEGFWSWYGSHLHGPGLHLCGLPCGWPWIWPPFPVFATDSRPHGWGGSNLEMTDSDRYLRSFTAGSVGIGEF